MTQNIYWWARGVDMYGHDTLMGAYSSDDEARERAKERIVGIIDVIPLPTRSMPRAKSMLRYQEAESTGDINAVNRKYRGY
jgi:hypothetical protein